MGEIMNALDRVRSVTGRPQAIVAHTVKGKGVSWVERDWSYHGKPLTEEELPRALEELKD
jgi:transketolase